MSGCTRWCDRSPRVSSFLSPCGYPGVSDASDTVPRNSLYACACAHLTGSYDDLCPMRQTVCKTLVSRFLQPRPRIRRKPAPALSFRPWPFSARPGCKPANRVRTQVRTFCVPRLPAQGRTDAASARLPTLSGANCKPCKPCFLVGRWRNAALAPPVLEYRPEGPLSPGACMRAPTITIDADHHHRHHHHKLHPV